MVVGMIVGAAWLWTGLFVYREFNPTPPPKCTPVVVHEPVYIIVEKEVNNGWPI